MSADELACQQVVELLSDHLDGQLSDDDQRRLVAHLGGCDGCAAALEQMRATLLVMGALSEDRVPEPERDRLRAAFKDRLREVPPPA